jgi:hypothetical protein
MTSIKNYKPATVLVAIAALAGVLVVSTVAIGSGHFALGAETETKTITKNLNNPGINVPTDTDQKQDCLTAGGQSQVSGSCTAGSTDTITQSGGILKK